MAQSAISMERYDTKNSPFLDLGSPFTKWWVCGDGAGPASPKRMTVARGQRFEQAWLAVVPRGVAASTLRVVAPADGSICACLRLQRQLPASSFAPKNNMRRVAPPPQPSCAGSDPVLRPRRVLIHLAASLPRACEPDPAAFVRPRGRWAPSVVLLSRHALIQFLWTAREMVKMGLLIFTVIPRVLIGVVGLCVMALISTLATLGW